MPHNSDRQDLAGEHALGDVGQIVLFLLFIATWTIDTFFVKFSTVLSGSIPLFVKIPLSVIILGIAGYFAKAGHDIVFGEVREGPTVIEHGVFSRVRHPLYLAAILLYLGLLLLSFSIMATVIWIIIILFYNYIAIYEEKILIAKFGNDYIDYMKKAPRWIPRLK